MGSSPCQACGDDYDDGGGGASGARVVAKKRSRGKEEARGGAAKTSPYPPHQPPQQPPPLPPRRASADVVGNSSAMTRLIYDADAYRQALEESTGPGNYWMSTPTQYCQDCFPSDPRLRIQKAGQTRCESMPFIDVDSELLGLTRRASHARANHAVPPTEAGFPRCQLGVVRECDPDRSSEDTRLSNPPCTLRGTDNGFNRWQWLCKDPQAHVEMPFDTLINSRIVAKDNHRPLLPTPMVERALPPQRGGGGGDLPPEWRPCQPPEPTFPTTFWPVCPYARRGGE